MSEPKASDAYKNNRVYFFQFWIFNQIKFLVYIGKVRSVQGVNVLLNVDHDKTYCFGFLVGLYYLGILEGGGVMFL